jgi:Reverse transcriptase (RNA-dependent DNA polymerase)
LDVTYIVYLDDICIFSDSVEKYAKYVREVLTRLKKAQLYVKFFKCEFYKEEIFFLKFVIGVYEIRIDNAKIKIIFDWPTPKSFKDI